VAASPTEQTIYSFCAQNNCTDGANPGQYQALIVDGAGNLYGTTGFGGAHGVGAVFQLTPSGSGWTEKVLYSFCSQSNCADGALPLAGLIMDGTGNLYGTTYQGANGGPNGDGVVFELTPNQDRTAWTETVIFRFCPLPLCAWGA
jgi:uncharacterized repeat protein (TIGR03803 family)